MVVARLLTVPEELVAEQLYLVVPWDMAPSTMFVRGIVKMLLPGPEIIC